MNHYERPRHSVRTQRFNLSITKAHFINPDCFGEDLAAWLKDKLIDRDRDVSQLGQEDWGWYLKVKCDKESYFLGMNGIPIETNQNQKDSGEWRIIVKKNRSIGQWLGNRGKIGAADNACSDCGDFSSGTRFRRCTSGR